MPLKTGPETKPGSKRCEVIFPSLPFALNTRQSAVVEPNSLTQLRMWPRRWESGSIGSSPSPASRSMSHRLRMSAKSGNRCCRFTPWPSSAVGAGSSFNVRCPERPSYSSQARWNTSVKAATSTWDSFVSPVNSLCSRRNKSAILTRAIFITSRAHVAKSSSRAVESAPLW